MDIILEQTFESDSGEIKRVTSSQVSSITRNDFSFSSCLMFKLLL